MTRPVRRPRRFGGLRPRIAVFLSAVAVLVLGGIGVTVERVTAERAHADARSRAAALLESVSVPSALDVAVGAIERLDDSLTELARAGRAELALLHLAMFDDRGLLIAHSGDGAFPDGADGGDAQPGLDFIEQAVAAKRPLWRYVRSGPDRELALLVSMPAVSGLRWGTLVGTFDLGRVRDRISWTRRTLALAGGGLAGSLVLALYFGLAALILRPVRHLADAVQRARAGDLGARAAVSTRDELGELAEGFNAMAAELQSYTAELEERVAERSAEVSRKNTELEQLNERLSAAVGELEVLARTDPLTGLSNRRHLFELLGHELRRGLRSPHALTLAILDVDYFKRFNDTYGHQLGDEVLRTIAEVLTGLVRAGDVVARYGGEEFVVMLLDTPGPLGVEAVSRLCRAVAETPITAPSGEAIGPITLSAGVVAVPEDPADVDELLRRADAAMYAAKAGGRDRVVRWSPEVEGAPDREDRADGPKQPAGS